MPDDSAATILNAGIVEDVVIDGRTITFDARQEIVLRCGDAKIMLRKDGKIVIRGTHLISRSRGVNKIKGGSVHIN